MPAQNWSRALPRPISILDNGEEFLRLTKLADVRDSLTHIPKERQRFETWQTSMPRQPAAAPMTFLSLRMVFQLERVEYR